jgi:hypothetical protein
MPTHKSSDYKLSAVKYYLYHSKNQIKEFYSKIKQYSLDDNVKDVLDEIPIHIYKNLIKGAYYRNENIYINKKTKT